MWQTNKSWMISQKAKGGEPQGVRKHLLSKKRRVLDSRKTLSRSTLRIHCFERRFRDPSPFYAHPLCVSPVINCHVPRTSIGTWISTPLRGSWCVPPCNVRLQEMPETTPIIHPLDLECRKWGFKRWGFKEIRGYLRKNAFFLRFLDFPGALQTLRKRAKKAEKGRKRPISADFQGGRPDTP